MKKSLYLLLLLLFPIGLQAQSEVIVLHPDEGKAEVNWELEHLEKADLIIMNILASSKSPITLLEMGLHMRSGKLHVICEPGFYRYDNVRITCNRYGVPLYHSMDEFLKTVR